MISDDITSCAAALGSLAGHVDVEHWALLRIVRKNLLAHAEAVKNLEDNINIMPGGCIALRIPGTNRAAVGGAE